MIHDVRTRPRPPANEHAEVFLIEDSPGDLRLLEEAFRESNTEVAVHSSTNGDDAIDALVRLQSMEPSMLPDLVLTDLQLAGSDGHAVLQAIKNDPQLRSLPVIVLTHSGDSEDITRCYEAGANAYLTKPTDLDGLLSLVETLAAFWLDLARRP